MNACTLEGASHLKLVCEFATGYDNVDLEYCRKRGIPVVNVVNYSTAAVAQHTISCVLYIPVSYTHLNVCGSDHDGASGPEDGGDA